MVLSHKYIQEVILTFTQAMDAVISKRELSQASFFCPGHLMFCNLIKQLCGPSTIHFGLGHYNPWPLLLVEHLVWDEWFAQATTLIIPPFYTSAESPSLIISVLNDYINSWCGQATLYSHKRGTDLLENVGGRTPIKCSWLGFYFWFIEKIGHEECQA